MIQPVLAELLQLGNCECIIKSIILALYRFGKDYNENSCNKCDFFHKTASRMISGKKLVSLN